MKKALVLAGSSILWLASCSQVESPVASRNNPSNVAIYSGDYVHVVVSNNNNTLIQHQMKGYGAIWTNLQGVPKAVSIGSSHGWVFDPANISNSNCGQSWHIGGDVNYNGHLWRLETRAGTTPGWMRRSIVINGTTILATDVGAKKQINGTNDKVFAVGATSVNGSNIFQFNQSTMTWSVFSSSGCGFATRIDVDDQFVPWCISGGTVYKWNGSSWSAKTGVAAADIGCGDGYQGVYVVTTAGGVKRLNFSTWQDVPEFSSLGKVAKKIDASAGTFVVSTTTGEIWAITPSTFTDPGKANMSQSAPNADDVSCAIEYPVHY
jgi:hypothetical protein